MNADYALHGKLAQGKFAALFVNNILDNLYLGATTLGLPSAETVYLGRIERRYPAIGGYFVKLPRNRDGFFKSTTKLDEGTYIPVQVSGYAESSKAVPLTPNIRFKGKYLIATPGKPGMNISRAIRNKHTRQHLHTVLEGFEQFKTHNIGLIARTCAEVVKEKDILTEATNLFNKCSTLEMKLSDSKLRILFEAPDVHEVATREWFSNSGDRFFKEADDIDLSNMENLLEGMLSGNVNLCHGSFMCIEPTRSVVCIDINTGQYSSKKAISEVSLAAACSLPRELRLRGLGGQIIVDFPSMSETSKAQISHMMHESFKHDSVPTTLVGWTKMGLFELHRKRDRISIHEFFAQ